MSEQYPEKVTTLHVQDSLDVTVQDVVDDSRPEQWQIDDVNLKDYHSAVYGEEYTPHMMHLDNLNNLFSGEFHTPVVLSHQIVNPDGSEIDDYEIQHQLLDEFLAECEERIYAEYNS